MGVAPIICKGLGPGGAVGLIVTKGYTTAAAVVVTPPVTDFTLDFAFTRDFSLDFAYTRDFIIELSS